MTPRTRTAVTRCSGFSTYESTPRPPLYGAQIATLRDALSKLEHTEQRLDGRHFRPYPVRKRKEALRDLIRAAERYEAIMADERAEARDA